MAHNVLRAERDQPFLLPPGLRDWLPHGHLVWFILDVGRPARPRPLYRAPHATAPRITPTSSRRSAPGRTSKSVPVPYRRPAGDRDDRRAPAGLRRDDARRAAAGAGRGDGPRARPGHRLRGPRPAEHGQRRRVLRATPVPARARGLGRQLRRDPAPGGEPGAYVGFLGDESAERSIAPGQQAYLY